MQRCMCRKKMRACYLAKQTWCSQGSCRSSESFLVSELSLSTTFPMDGPLQPCLHPAPSRPLSFTDTWAHVHLDGLPSHAQVHLKPDAAASFPKLPWWHQCSPVLQTRCFRTVLSLCSFSCHVPSPLGAFPVMQVLDGAVLLEVTRVCVLRPAIVVGCLDCLIITLYCVYHGVSHTYLVLNNF